MTSDTAPAPERPFTQLSVYLVALSVGLTTMSFNVWYPFLPLYALRLGATSDANALFWVFCATSAQGIGRLVTGPAWGVLSDRFGRKSMLLRALFLSTLTGMVAAVVQAPWQLTIAMALNGLLSGLIPPAIALISVSVPESRLNAGLSTITGAQYIGTTTGPLLGAVLAVLFGYRGSIFVASLIPFIAAFSVLFWVPRDRVAVQRLDQKGKKVKLEPFKMTGQFKLLVFIYFVVFALNQLIRLATPIVLRAIEGRDDVQFETGMIFAAGGLVSAISVLVVGPRIFRPGNRRWTMAIACVIAAVGFSLIVLAPNVAVYVCGFLLVAAVLSAMVPTTNTLIAATASRARRGTAFGIAGSAQAMSFVVGPGGAALFAAISMDAGFTFLAGFLLAVGALIFFALKEPTVKQDEA